MDGAPRRTSRTTRIVKGTVPVLAVLGLLDALSREPRQNLLDGILVEALCALVLWLAWRWMQGTFVTKWAGRFLAAYLALGLVLFAFAVTLTIGEIVLAIVLMAIPALLWDLFVWQPHKGRFARARAARRGLPQ